jgi:S1-C subfamily serine protease
VQVARRVVGLRGDVQSGNSGGPIVNESGEVLATVFGKRSGRVDEGYAVPNGKVQNALANVGPPVRTACVER